MREVVRRPRVTNAGLLMRSAHERPQIIVFPLCRQSWQNVPTMNNREDLCAPARQGLYDPSTESDACGVGFVVHMKGRKSHDIVEKALQVLINLEHRGACGCEANTGDGAGILVQMPDAFLRKVVPFTLPAVGSYGAGLVFLPHDERDREAIKEVIARIIAEEGQTLLGWREVPSDNRDLGDSARATQPTFEQLFIDLSAMTAETGSSGVSTEARGAKVERKRVSSAGR